MPTVITSESIPPNSFKAVIASSKANALTETGIAQALASKGLTDAQGRQAIANAASIAEGLRAIGLIVEDGSVAPTPTPTPTPGPTPTPTPGSSVFGSGVWNDTATWDDTHIWKDAA